MVIYEMSKQDCVGVLSRVTLGRLACAHNNQPYIVPIYFVYEGTSLYGFTTRGQKIDWMRSNPFVCIEIDEIESSLRWLSVLVFGRYEELTDTAAIPSCDLPQGQLTSLPLTNFLSMDPSLRAHAHELLQSHRGSWWEPGCASGILRHSKDKFEPIYYRICIDHITGRRATSDS